MPYLSDFNVTFGRQRDDLRRRGGIPAMMRHHFSGLLLRLLNTGFGATGADEQASTTCCWHFRHR
jgi:hypothetical protein